MQQKPPVIIVGAGLTGLVAAYTLKKAGISSLILEAADRIGGRVVTIGYADGATAEAHMEEFWERTPIYGLLKELKIPIYPAYAQNAIRFRGKFCTHFGDLKKFLPQILSPSETKEFLAWNDETWELYQELHDTYFKGKPLTRRLEVLKKIRFVDWISSKMSPKTCELIRTLLEPEIAIELDHLAALDGIDEMRLFLNTPEGFGETSYHVAGGNIGLIHALAAKLPHGTILTERKAVEVKQGKGKVIVTCTMAGGRRESFTGKYALITVPLFAIGAIQFYPPLDPDRQKAIETTGFGSYIKIQQRVKREAAKTWAKAEKKGKIFPLISACGTGVIYNSTVFEKQLTEADDLLLTYLIYAKYARQWMELPEEEISRLVSEQMDTFFPGFSKYITSVKLFKYPAAIAFWPAELGRSRFDDLAHHLRQPFGQIFIGGDTTEDSHSEGASIAALRMAKEMIARLRPRARTR